MQKNALTPRETNLKVNNFEKMQRKLLSRGQVRKNFGKAANFAHLVALQIFVVVPHHVLKRIPIRRVVRTQFLKQMRIKGIVRRALRQAAGYGDANDLARLNLFESESPQLLKRVQVVVATHDCSKNLFAHISNHV